MLYSQKLTVGPNGVLQVNNIGGNAYADRERVVQVGRDAPTRFGFVNISGPESLRNAQIKLDGYFARQVGPGSLPGEVIMDLPCSLLITEAVPGTEVEIVCYAMDSVNGRGLKQSLTHDGTGTTSGSVPTWARSFDFSGGTASTATFRDDATNVVGVVALPVSDFSIPDRAATVDLAGSAGTYISFRQRG